MRELSLEPLKFYTGYAKDRHRTLAEEHFESLVRASGIDVGQNRSTVKKYDAECEKIKKLDAKIKLLKVFFWILIVIGSIGALILLLGINLLAEGSDEGGGMVIGGSVSSFIGFLISFAVIRPRIKSAEAMKQKHMSTADGLFREALAQMAPLNALFDDQTTHRLIEKTMPEVKFDRLYSNDAERLLIEDFDYLDMTDDNTSVLNALSGTLFENPFLFERYMSHEMGTHTYHGTLVIRWTERRRDGNGRTVTTTRTQTLHASVVKPKPYYFVRTHLGFGSQSAPDLSFTRGESDTDELSDRALARRIKQGEKKLLKKARDAVTRGGSFQEMTNSEFDVLFGATDRDHEVQFRLLFTPLAQNNTVDLLRSKDGFGDDFSFIKRGKFNIVKSKHSESWDMNISAERYCSHSVDISKKTFISFNEEYFKSVFFDLAPIMAIPAYREGPVASMKDPKPYIGCYNQYEHEALANAIGEAAFAHEASATRAILKTSMLEKMGDVDRVSVIASSYRAVNRIDYVPVFGGDGRTHLVPVPWVEYVPVCKSSEMLVKSLGHTDKELRDKGAGLPKRGAYLHGILAYAPAARQSWEQINEFFKKYI